MNRTYSGKAVDPRNKERMNMKRMKQIFALALALALCIGLMAGCGNGTAPSGSAATPAPAGTPGTGASGESGFTTVEPGKLHMSTNASFPPYEMTTDAGGDRKSTRLNSSHMA